MAHSVLTDDLMPKHECDREVLEYIERHPELPRNVSLQGLGEFIRNTARTFQRELKYWGVVEFPVGRKQLLLSDFPCIRTTGVGKPDVVFALPLSPWKAVLGFKTIETQRMYVDGMTRRELHTRINESSIHWTTRYILRS